MLDSETPILGIWAGQDKTRIFIDDAVYFHKDKLEIVKAVYTLKKRVDFIHTNPLTMYACLQKKELDKYKVMVTKYFTQLS
ncbi:MAG: hypothetical protein R6U37_10015 [Dehalococcoidia bacterium]